MSDIVVVIMMVITLVNVSTTIHLEQEVEQLRYEKINKWYND